MSKLVTIEQRPKISNTKINLKGFCLFRNEGLEIFQTLIKLTFAEDFSAPWIVHLMMYH
jgi:hypothetical protein